MTFWDQIIEIVVSLRSSLAKGKSAILFWHNCIANKLTFSPLLINVFLFLCYKTVYLSADLQTNYARIKSCFSLLSNYV